MAYTPYVTAAQYDSFGYSDIPTLEIDQYLREASRQIDTLTFNRIVAIGFDKLTEFQQEIIQECVCRHADFLYDNKDALASVFDTYTINTVSMKFGTGFNVCTEDGIAIRSDVYHLLQQTGLCCRIAR